MSVKCARVVWLKMGCARVTCECGRGDARCGCGAAGELDQ